MTVTEAPKVRATGLPAPDPQTEVAEVEPSPALSQLGQEWPADGRIVGIVAEIDQNGYGSNVNVPDLLPAPPQAEGPNHPTLAALPDAPSRG